jgi:CHAT domain-containing protein/tetratricopeptide (TPR) repeat protein
VSLYARALTISSLLGTLVLWSSTVASAATALLAPATATRFTQPPPLPDSIRAWIQAGRLTEADSAARALLPRAEREHGKESLEAAEAIDLIVEAMWRSRRANTADAQPLAERAVRIKERLLPPDDIHLTPSWLNLANIHIQFGEPARAHPLIERTLKLQEKALGKDHLQVAETLHLLSLVLHSLGEREAALETGRRSLAIREARLPPGDPLIAISLDHLARIEADLCEYEKARALYLRAIGILESGQGPVRLTLSLVIGNLAVLQDVMGDYAGAKASFDRAAAIQREAGAGYRPLGFTMTSLGLTLRKMGDFGAARDTLERALFIRTKALGPDHPNVATTLTALGDVMAEAGDLNGARRAYERSLAIRNRAGISKDPKNADALIGLSDVAARSGELGVADSLCGEAVSILQSVYGPREHPVAQAQAARAKLRRKLGDLAGARALLREALAAEADLLGEDHPDVAEAASWLARVEMDQGDRTAALDAALRAERVAREHLRRTGRTLSEREAMNYAATRTRGLDAALTLVQAGSPDSSVRRVCDAVIRSRALVLDEMAARNRLFAAARDTTLERLVENLTRTTRLYTRLVVRGPDDSHSNQFKAELGAARQSRESAERALGEYNAEFRSERAAAHIGLDEVASSLSDGQVILAYVLYSDLSASRAPIVAEPVAHPRYAAFVIRRSGQVSFVPLGDAARIDALVQAWRREIQNGLGNTSSSKSAEARCRAAGDRLRAAIWDAAQPFLSHVAHVLVVPDGALSLVPFAALPTASGAFLVEQEPLVSYLSTERDVVRSAEAPKNATLLVVGGLDFDDPDLFAQLARHRRSTQAGARDHVTPEAGEQDRAFRGARTSCGGFRSASFAALPASKREIADIVSIWERAHEPREGAGHGVQADACVSLNRSKGTEAAFKALAPRAGIVHLATHGFFVDDTCSASRPGTRSMGGLSPEANTAQAPRVKHQAPENPLILSGLALAGANHRDAAGELEEDAILTAEEIAAMDLSGVRWVVLSACDTGIGPTTSGEGVQGLRRAFQIAGASTLIMSLWSVEDRATREWMRFLYQARLSSGLGSAEAAREASRAVLGRLRKERGISSPGLWAGFVMVGDWR